MAVIATGGHGHTRAGTIEADGPDDFRKKTREQLKAGADLIKMCISGGIAGEHEAIRDAQLSKDEMRAVIETAHGSGKKVTAHAGPTGVIRAAIECASGLVKDGLASARQAVGALRGDELPGVAQLPALIESFREGLNVDATLTVEGEARTLPADASLALYRGAQEALANAARYAPGAITTVLLRYHAEQLAVRLATPERHARGDLLVELRGGHVRLPPAVGGDDAAVGLGRRVDDRQDRRALVVAAGADRGHAGHARAARRPPRCASP